MYLYRHIVYKIGLYDSGDSDIGLALPYKATKTTQLHQHLYCTKMWSEQALVEMFFIPNCTVGDTFCTDTPLDCRLYQSGVIEGHKKDQMGAEKSTYT